MKKTVMIFQMLLVMSPCVWAQTRIDAITTDDRLYAANSYFEIGELDKAEQNCKLVLIEVPDHAEAKQLLQSIKKGQY